MDTLVIRYDIRKWTKRLFLIVLVILVGYAIGKMANHAGYVRLLLASSLLVPLLAISHRKPVIVLQVLLLYLPFMSLFRRMLIPIAGWNSMDPLLLIAPVTVLYLLTGWLFRTYVKHEPIRDDTFLFRCVRWMLLIDFLQIFNPLQGSLLTGIAGVIYWIVPVCFMFLSREFIDEKVLKRIFGMVFATGILIAMYGYKQFMFGFAPFELQWIEMSGYTALRVYSVLRPISTFASGAEYAHYLGIAIIIGWVYVLRGGKTLKLAALAGVIFMYINLFIESARGIILIVTIAMFVITIMSSRKTVERLIVTCLALGVLAGLFVGMGKLNTDNDLIYHSVAGLTDPFGEDSTAIGHLHLLGEGLIKGLSNPLGHGLGSTTIAGNKFSGQVFGTEADLTNKFIASGIIAGILYFIIIAYVFYQAFKQANSGDAVYLVILGVLIAGKLQWLTGGHYSVVPLIWILIGYLDKHGVRRVAHANRMDGSYAQ